MKKILLLVILIPAIQAKWIDENHYSMENMKYDINTKIIKYCVNGEVLIAANRGVNQVGLVKSDTENCLPLSKQEWKNKYDK